MAVGQPSFEDSDKGVSAFAGALAMGKTLFTGTCICGDVRVKNPALAFRDDDSLSLWISLRAVAA